MVRSLISWVVVGVLTYLWYRIGYGWEYLQDIPRGDWDPAWILYTLVTLLLLRRLGSAANDGANVVEAVVKRIKGIVSHLPGLTLALLVGLTIFSLENGGFSKTEYIQAVIVAVGAAVTTAAWLGAMEDASK